MTNERELLIADYTAAPRLLAGLLADIFMPVKELGVFHVHNCAMMKVQALIHEESKRQMLLDEFAQTVLKVAGQK